MDNLSPQRIVVMASGRGSNFEALLRAEKQGLLSPFQIVGLVCNRSSAGALKIAKDFKIPTYVLESTSFRNANGFDRNGYEKELQNCLGSLKPDWICLAGYLLVLGPGIIRTFPGKIINIHPSLLPKYKGLHAQRQALEAGEKITGCSVHFVSEDLDGGPLILQKSLEILPNETEESLTKRLLAIEHKAYVEALQLIAKKISKVI